MTLLKAFGEDVCILLSDPYLAADQAQALGVCPVSIEELLAASDVVSLHAPLTENTKAMLSKKQFALMRDGCLFINTARGALVDHDALYTELSSGRIKACLDVYLETCDNADESPYRGLRNVLITPGIAGPSAQELERFFGGQKLRYRVEPDRLDIIA